MTEDTTPAAIYPGRDPDETHTIAERLKSVFRAHRAHPEDPERRCLCGFDGESYDDHLADSTLREMKEVGYEVWPARHN